MTNNTILKENLKGNKVKIQNQISSLKKIMMKYKEERKSEWKLFKNKFNDDIDVVKKSFKKMDSHHHKKRHQV